MFARRLVLMGAAVLALAACDRGDEQPANSEPALVSQAVRTVAGDGTRLTPGLWNIEEAAGGASAAFAEVGKAPVVVLICDRNAGTVTLAMGEGDVPLTKRLSLGDQQADLQMKPDANGRLSAAIDGSQPVFAGWTDPASVIAIGEPDAPSLRIPGHVGIGRVFAACS